MRSMQVSLNFEKLKEKDDNFIYTQTLLTPNHKKKIFLTQFLEQFHKLLQILYFIHIEFLIF